jgi:hypothetical protein
MFTVGLSKFPIELSSSFIVNLWVHDRNIFCFKYLDILHPLDFFDFRHDTITASFGRSLVNKMRIHMYSLPIPIYLNHKFTHSVSDVFIHMLSSSSCELHTVCRAIHDHYAKILIYRWITTNWNTRNTWPTMMTLKFLEKITNSTI